MKTFRQYKIVKAMVEEFVTHRPRIESTDAEALAYLFVHYHLPNAVMPNAVEIAVLCKLALHRTLFPESATNALHMPSLKELADRVKVYGMTNPEASLYTAYVDLAQSLLDINDSNAKYNMLFRLCQRHIEVVL